MTALGKALAGSAATLLALAAAAAPAVAAPSADEPPPPKKLFTIKDDRITESSGLAKSVKFPGIWWTTNDSNDSARIFGVDKNGEVRAVLTFEAEVRDVEALAISKDGRIYVGDIGDNEGVRDQIHVYSMAEPEKLENQQVRFRQYDFEYPDGAHNAETLMIHPRNDRLYVVTKEQKKGGLYAAPEVASREGVNKLKRVGDMPALATDGTFMPDALRIVVRTYLSMTAMTWSSPKPYATVQLPIAQGESLAIGPTDNTVVAGSEGSNSAVYQVQVPPRKAAVPPKATTKPANTGAGDTEAESGGTLRWILLGAGVFALIVALMTFPTGRRERQDALIEQQRLDKLRDRDQRDRYSRVGETGEHAAYVDAGYAGSTYDETAYAPNGYEQNGYDQGYDQGGYDQNGHGQSHGAHGRGGYDHGGHQQGGVDRNRFQPVGDYHNPDRQDPYQARRSTV